MSDNYNQSDCKNESQAIEISIKFYKNPIKGDPVKVEKCWKQLINGSTQVITCNLSDVNPEFIFRGYFQR